MPIPDFQSLMLPTLQQFKNGEEISSRILRERLAALLHLTAEDLALLLPSGVQTLFVNRISWAIAYMSRAGLMERTTRGVYRISNSGKELLNNTKLLNENNNRIDVKFLHKNFQAYRDYYQDQSTKSNGKNLTEFAENETQGRTPEELVDENHQFLISELARELLEKVKSSEPSFFEHLVVDLLVKMGYGGITNDGLAKVTGRSGDNGIDGFINQDRLGLDVVYIQAKRWENATVGEPVVRDFVGSLEAQRAKKGVLLTTSRFSDDALKYIGKIEKKVILIDGIQLAQLMIEYNLGVSTVKTYELKKIDSDYFPEV